MNIYAQHILDHYKNPRNWGRLSGDKISHHEANHLCGDVLDVDVKIKSGKISEFGFEGSGCAISLAATSILSEYIVGKSPKHILDLKEKNIQTLLKIPISERRQKCAMLGLLALQNALKKSS